MKKILIVNGSKRLKGNSYALEARIVEQLKGKAEVTCLDIAKKDVRPCLACDACKQQHTPNCIQKDDFTALIPEIDNCDAMLILAPVHWDQLPAQLKAFLDRTYSFMDFTQPDFSMATRKDKKIAAVFGTQYCDFAEAVGAKVSAMDNATYSMQELLAGRVDGGVQDAADRKSVV